MKDRVREAVFNLLGPSVKGKLALDLFAGTGALGLEALSRGAVRAVFLERHHPTAQIIRENITTLGVQSIAEVISANTFLRGRWQQTLDPAIPWLIFASPPYAFWIDRAEEMMDLMGFLFQSAPAESVLVAESDDQFDMRRLPDPEGWDVRTYPPAVVGIYRKNV